MIRYIIICDKIKASARGSQPVGSAMCCMNSAYEC